MLELSGNIWDHIDDYTAIVITTNGFVKKNGEAVMGRGIALEAKNRYPWLAADLGELLKEYGNYVYVFPLTHGFLTAGGSGQFLITLPVKPEYGPTGAPGWKAKADIALIEDSIKQLAAIFNYEVMASAKIIMPRPGCGNGGLKWEDVKPVIEPYLDDRFVVMEKN